MITLVSCSQVPSGHFTVGRISRRTMRRTVKLRTNSETTVSSKGKPL